jgi:hypothetical protein
MSSPIRLLALSLLVVPGLLLLALAAPARAEAPNALTLVDYGPQMGNALAVARVADNAGTGWTWQVNGSFTFQHNNAGEALELTRLTISYPDANPAIAPRHVAYASTIRSIRAYALGIFDGHDRDLTTLPPTIRLELKFAEYSEPAVLTLPLAFYENTVPGGAFFFPTKQSDLADPGWRYFYRTRHTMDQGRGDQRWGYDIGVMRWNGSGWSDVKSSAESLSLDDRANTDYLIWGAPLYAMGDGTVVACYDGEVDHPPQSDFDDENPTWEYGAGNHLEIDYGGDRVVLAHNRHDSIPDELCPGPDHQYHTGLNIPVRAGQFIGRVGNTGRSTNAHIHLHVYNEDADDTADEDLRGGRGVPALFRNLRSVADQERFNDLGQSPNYGQHDGKVLHRVSLFQPNPCGFPQLADDATERSFVRLTSECYQDLFNVATAKGWVPNLVDGYEVAGLSRFNATFRPSTGASWSAAHDQPTAQMAGTIVSNVIAGRRLHWIDAYKSGSEVRYAAVFFDRPGPDQDVFFDRSQTQWNAEFAQRADDGYVPVNVAIAQDSSGALRYTSVWEKFATAGWTLQLPAASGFSSVVASEEAAGRKPVYMNAFRVGTTPYVTGLFVAGVGGTTTRNIDVDTASLELAIAGNANSNRPIRAMAGYDNGASSSRFVALWRSPINTTISSGPANGSSTTSTSASFGFRADNPFSIEFRCRKSNTVAYWLPCTSPKAYTGLDPGQHSFEVRASDRDLLTDPTPASRNWVIATTLPINQAPVTSGIASRGHAEGAEVYVDVSAAFSDPDGDALTLSTDSVLPQGLDFQAGVFQGTFSFASDGVYPIVITASDGKGGTVDATFNWTITDTNRTPTTSGIANQNLAEGAEVTLDVRPAFSDPDGDGLTLDTSSALPDGLVFSSGVFSGTLSYASEGVYPITVTANDGKGGNAATAFTWTVAHSVQGMVIFVSGFE